MKFQNYISKWDFFQMTVILWHGETYLSHTTLIFLLTIDFYMYFVLVFPNVYIASSQSNELISKIKSKIKDAFFQVFILLVNDQCSEVDNKLRKYKISIHNSQKTILSSYNDCYERFFFQLKVIHVKGRSKSRWAQTENHFLYNQNGQLNLT